MAWACSLDPLLLLLAMSAVMSSDMLDCLCLVRIHDDVSLILQVRETPYWLVENSLEKEARSALQWSPSPSWGGVVASSHFFPSLFTENFPYTLTCPGIGVPTMTSKKRLVRSLTGETLKMKIKPKSNLNRIRQKGNILF